MVVISFEIIDLSDIVGCCCNCVSFVVCILRPAEVNAGKLIEALIEWPVEVSKALSRYRIDDRMTSAFVFTFKKLLKFP